MPSSLHRYHYQLFRSLLVAARERSGLTQAQVAEQLNRPQSYISKYERGERRLDFTEFVELAEVLGINIPDFVATYKTSIDVSTQKIRKTKKLA